MIQKAALVFRSENTKSLNQKTHLSWVSCKVQNVSYTWIPPCLISCRFPIEYFIPVSLSCHLRLEFEQVYPSSFRHVRIVVKPQPISWNTIYPYINRIEQSFENLLIVYGLISNQTIMRHLGTPDRAFNFPLAASSWSSMRWSLQNNESLSSILTRRTHLQDGIYARWIRPGFSQGCLWRYGSHGERRSLFTNWIEE